MADGNVTYEQTNSSFDDDGTGTSGDAQNGYQLIVINDEGSVLPEAGGSGITLIYLFGGLMCLSAAIALVVRRRMLKV